MRVSRVITEIDAGLFSQHAKFLAVIRQERIDHGELIRWTKGFGAANTEGEDVAAMFRESLKKHVSVSFLWATKLSSIVDVPRGGGICSRMCTQN
jgi:hypothetical protein